MTHMPASLSSIYPPEATNFRAVNPFCSGFLCMQAMEIVRKLNQDLFGNLRIFCTRVVSLGNGIVRRYCKLWDFQSLNVVVGIGSLLFFIFALVCVYFYLFPSLSPVMHSYEIVSTPRNGSISAEKCNVFEGKWIQDESYPLYNASQCPFAERGFNCLANGRRDRGYTKWRWKPKNCDIPRLDVRKILGKLYGKRVVFVGDSLSRTQWESLICMLMTGVDDKRSVYEVNGNKITKQIRFLGVRFSTYNLRIDFYRSVFLVRPSSVPRRAPKRVKSTLRLDLMDDISKEWIDSDVLVFNSGHWWTPTKLFEMGCYFQVGKSLKLGMPINTAFRKALDTWAYWVENMVNTNRTSVFFRTFESSHWGGKNRNTCKVNRRPWSRTNGRDRSKISDNIVKVVKQMKVPVNLLHVTRMGAFRSDGHVGTWGDNPSVPDCSHWCLPGVPDVWNEILLSSLLNG